MRISRGGGSIFWVIALVLILAIFVPTAASAQQVPEPREDVVAVLNIEVLRSGAGAVVVPVRVTVLSRRALEGTLELRVPNANVSFELPVGLAANSEVSQTFVVPTAGNASMFLNASLVVDGEVVAESEANGPQANTNAVGVLGLAAPSDGAQLRPLIGQASLIEIDDLTLLPALDTVVTSDAGLRSLSQGERDQLLRWVAAGRQLAVADSPGSIDSFLPSDWQSGDALVGAGTGFIRYIGTDWADNVPAGVSAATNVQFMAGFFDTSSPELLSDAGFTVPGLGALSILLLVYLLVAGPIAFVALKVTNRQTLAWVVLPALAVVFAGGVFGVGRLLNSGRSDGYATVVEVSPVGETITDTVLISRSGRQTLELPEGWVVTSTALSGGFGQVGAPVVISPTRGSTNVRFDIDTGSGGSAVLTGSTDSIGEVLAISDLSIDGESLMGTVRNSSGERLENVAVMVGERVVSVDDIDDGGSQTFVLDLGVNRNQFAPEVATWGADPRNGFGEFDIRQGNQGVEDGATNGSVWLQWRTARLGTAVPEGMVTAVGWSRDLDSSMVDGKGRTALVAHAALPAPDGPVLPAQIRVVRLAVPGQDGFGNFNGDFAMAEPAIGFDGEFGNAGVLASQFIRPAGSDTSGVALEVGNQVGGVEVWTSDDEWRFLPLADAGQNVTFTIPEQGWIDDVLTVRYNLLDFFGDAGQMSTRLTPVTARTVEGVLLDAGETSRRDFFDGGGFPGGEAALGSEFEVVLEDDDTFEGTGEIFGTYDVWLLDLQEGDEVTVRMLADGGGFGQVNLDPFLLIRDPGGVQVAENDDDGNGLNSRVEFTARTDGTFSIETRPLGGMGSQGQYQVTIDVTPVEGDAS